MKHIDIDTYKFTLGTRTSLALSIIMWITFALGMFVLTTTGAHAASVVSSSTTKLTTNSDGSMIADFEYVLEDNNSVQHTVTERARLAAGTNVDAFRIARHPVQLEAKAHQEREDAIATDDGRCDYLFFEVSANNFIDAVPNWNPCMQVAQATSFSFWSREDMLEILPFRPCWTYSTRPREAHTRDRRDLCIRIRSPLPLTTRPSRSPFRWSVPARRA